MQQIVFRLPAQQKQLLQQRARKNKSSVSAELRQAVDKHLSQEQTDTENDKPLLLQLADMAVETGESESLSTSYKEYLYSDTKEA